MKKLILSTFAICTIVVCFLSITKVSAQSCSIIPEVAVTNIEQIRPWVIFTSRFPIFNDSKLVGFTMIAEKAKGHKGSGGCCSFEAGTCKAVAHIEVTVDRYNNILTSNTKMFIGKNEDGPVIRYEEFSN